MYRDILYVLDRGHGLQALAARVALVAGFRRALRVFRYMIVVAVAVGMWESPQGYPRGVGSVESRLLGLSMLSIPRHFHGLFSGKVGLQRKRRKMCTRLCVQGQCRSGDIRVDLESP